MQSWLDNALAAFERDNEHLVLGTRSLLARVIERDGLHARLVNTLSLLEHMGSHKIMATQHSPAIDQPTLKHLSEETQHAWFMKRQAEKIARRPMEYSEEDLLSGPAARGYFQRLEAAMVRTLARQGSARAAYLYMSMIVEFRALWFYGLHQQTLRRAGHALSLKRVLAEEQNHLADVANRLERGGELSDARAGEFMQRERALYERLLGKMQREVSLAR